MEEDIYEQYKDILDELSEIASTQKDTDSSGTDYRWCDEGLLNYSLQGLSAEKIY